MAHIRLFSMNVGFARGVLLLLAQYSWRVAQVWGAREADCAPYLLQSADVGLCSGRGVPGTGRVAHIRLLLANVGFADVDLALLNRIRSGSHAMPLPILLHPGIRPALLALKCLALTVDAFSSPYAGHYSGVSVAVDRNF